MLRRRPEVTATGSQPLWENQWRLEWVCLERVETSIGCRNWGIAAGMIAAQVLPGRGPICILPRGQLSLKARCHAAIFSTSPRRGGLPRLHLSGQPRVPTPELGPHSDLISHGRLLPGLVTVWLAGTVVFSNSSGFPFPTASKTTGRAKTGARPW